MFMRCLADQSRSNLDLRECELRAGWCSFTHSGDRLDVLTEQEGCGAVRVAPLDEDVSLWSVDATDDVVLAPIRTETNIDRERKEWTSAPVAIQRRAGDPHAPLPGGWTSARKAIGFSFRERFDETSFDAELGPFGDGRLIGRCERRKRRQSECADERPVEKLHGTSLQLVLSI